MKQNLLFYCCLVTSVILLAFCGRNDHPSEKSEPVKIILDTDIGEDSDDAGALAVAHALADLGEAEILAIGTSVNVDYPVLAVDAINTWYGRGDIPIGTTKSEDAVRWEKAHGDQYSETLAKEYPRTNISWNNADDAPDVVDVYRKTLADQPDINENHPGVVIVSIGFKTNMRDLLKSEPCEHSDLPGTKLVENKVRLWVPMAKRMDGNRENNIREHPKAAQYAFENWPTPVVISPYEVGIRIKSGSALLPLDENHMIRRAYDLVSWKKALSKYGTASFDQSAVLYAVRGIDGGPAKDYWDLSKPGQLKVNPDGTTEWNPHEHAMQRYLIENRDPDLIADELDEMMARWP